MSRTVSGRAKKGGVMQRIFLFVCSLVLLGIAVGVQDQRFEAELKKGGNALGHARGQLRMKTAKRRDGFYHADIGP
jgi:hypothetical protein